MRSIHCFIIQNCIPLVVSEDITEGYPHHLNSVRELEDRAIPDNHLVFIDSNGVNAEPDTFLAKFKIVLVVGVKETDIKNLLSKPFVVDALDMQAGVWSINLMCRKFQAKNETAGRKQIINEDSAIIFQNFMRQFPGSAYIKDSTGHFLYANPTFYKLLSLEEADLIGKTTDDIQPAYIAQRCRQHDQMALFKQHFTTEELVELPDGTLKILDQHRFSIKLNGYSNLIAAVGFDKTQQLKMEQELIESQNKFKGYTENSPFAVIICQAEGIIDYANTQALMLLNSDSENTIGKHLSLFNIVSKKTEQWDNLRSDLQTGNYHLETKIVSADQKEIQVELYAVRIEDESYLFQFNDISIRKEQETELSGYRMHLEEIIRERTQELDEMNQELFETFALLADNNTFLESVIDNLPIGLEILDPDFCSVRMNSQSAEIWGFDAQSEREYKGIIWNDPCVISAGLDVIINKSRAGIPQQNISIELHPDKKTPKYKKLLVTIFTIYTNDGVVKNTVLLYNDITQMHKVQLELNATELRFRDFVENSPAGSLLTDETGNIIIWNNKLQEIFATPKEKMLGKNVVAITRLNKGNIFESTDLQEITQFFSTGNGSFLCHVREKQIHINNDRTIDLLIRSFRLKSDKGYSLGVVTEDISIQKSAEREVIKALEKEKHLNDLKSGFVSMASHQFKTPLATILSSTELLESYIEKLEQQQQTRLSKHVDRISTQTVRLNEMITDFLMLGRIETGRTQVVLKEFSITELIQEIQTEHFRNKYPNQQLIVKLLNDERTILADVNLFRHILLNTISNAYKYSSTDPRISLKYHDKHIDIQIDDDGIGIPANELGLIFDSFFRAKNAETYKGSGLGLAIVKRFVEAHEGTISFKSIPNQGTSAYISIPC